MMKRSLTVMIVALGVLLSTTASAAPRALNCNGKKAKKFLAQMLAGRSPSGWGAATPRRGVVVKMNDPSSVKKAGRGVKTRRDGFNQLHMVRYHESKGTQVRLLFDSKQLTDTLVQMCTYEIPYNGTPKLVASPKTTLRYKRHREARLTAAPAKDTYKKGRVSLIWVSPSSSIANGQTYKFVAQGCKGCKAGASAR